MASSSQIVSGGFLVLAPAGFMPPRLRLQAGVYAVAVASAPGTGRAVAVRGVAAGAEAGNTAAGGVLFLAPAGTRVPAAAPGTGRRGAARSVAADAASEAGDTDDDAYVQALLDLEGGKKLVFEFWAGLESSGADNFMNREEYELACFASHIVAQMKTTATRGAEFASRVLQALRPEGFSDLNVSRESDLNNLKVAGMRFRHVVLEAKKGYVRATSVREAARALMLLCTSTLSAASAPTIRPDAIALDDVPFPMDDPPTYYKNLGESFARLTDAAELAFQQQSRRRT